MKRRKPHSTSLGPAEVAALPRLLRCLAVPIHDQKLAAAAGTGMTVRMVTRTEAVPDAPTEKFVKALTDARIIVTTDDLIGIAHQRVFESWVDARRIIAEHRDFFRIREEVTVQFRRWSENKRPKALLLAKGLPLAEAQQIVKPARQRIESGNSGLCRNIEPKGPARQHHRRNCRRGLCRTCF